MSNKPTNKKNKSCGIVMPISPNDGCSAEHWADVYKIVKDILSTADYDVKLVSEADDIGIIQKRIIQNIYNNDIIVCDVSAKNPNVMFELGLRLAFDKPTVIIKDNKTDYSFDTSVIEHIQYPRDLRFNLINEFKDKLLKKVNGTLEASEKDKDYTTFLKHFGNYKIAKLDEQEVSSQDYLINAIEELKVEMISLKNRSINDSLRTRRLRDLKTFDESRVAVMRSVVKKYFDDYLKANPIRRYKELLIVKDEIYEYLENNDEVREICTNGQVISELLDELIYSNKN